MSDIVIIGGGPSGLAATLEAVDSGATATVVERLDQVGGLARTIAFRGSRFDVGPHRFFTRNEEVNALFERVLGDDLIRVARQTRILHDGVFFDYPLTPLRTVRGIGFRKGMAVAGSYAAARIRRSVSPRPAETLEDWVVDHFGRRLFETFFKTYTEKVWGVPCRQIGADWAAQRIKGLSLGTALRNALFKSSSPIAKTLVDEFSYPRLGAGQTYEKMAKSISAAGGKVLTQSKATRILREGTRLRAVVIGEPGGTQYDVEGRYFLTSATLTDTIEMMDPPAPPEVLRACRALRYRDHLAVNLLVTGSPFPDNWIYVHSRDVAMARVTNYRNFSPEMAGGAGVDPITVEYFAFPGDALSSLDDDRLIERAKDELMRLGIISRDQVSGAFVVRSEKAYPLIEIGYQNHLDTIRRWLDLFDNLLPIGRAGMFRYNNQDHAIATGLLAARTALGTGRFDPWCVNIDAEYQEAGPATSGATGRG